MKKNVLTLLVAFCTCLPISAEELCNYVENESSLGINMVYVEGGTFQMGKLKSRLLNLQNLLKKQIIRLMLK